MLPELHAESQLDAITAASVPHMKADAQRDVLRSFRDRIAPTKAPPANDLTLAAAGIRVRRVPKKAEVNP